MQSKRYIPRPYRTKAKALEIMMDLLLPYSPTSPWRQMHVEFRPKERAPFMFPRYA